MLLGFESVQARGFLAEVQEQPDLMAEFGQRPEGAERDIGRSLRSHNLSYHDILSAKPRPRLKLVLKDVKVKLQCRSWRSRRLRFLPGRKTSQSCYIEAI